MSTSEQPYPPLPPPPGGSPDAPPGGSPDAPPGGSPDAPPGGGPPGPGPEPPNDNGSGDGSGDGGIDFSTKDPDIYLPIYVMTGIFGGIFILAPLLVRKGPNQGLIRTCIWIATFSMWIFWFTVYVAQMNPLIGPRIKNTTLAWIAHSWGKSAKRPPPTTSLSTDGGDDDIEIFTTETPTPEGNDNSDACNLRNTNTTHSTSASRTSIPLSSKHRSSSQEAQPPGRRSSCSSRHATRRPTLV